MTSTASVFIIIVNWNGRAVTLDCLESLRQVSDPPARVLVVDNGSADGSVDAIRAGFPSVEILALGRNSGFAGGTNAGIRHALDHGARQLVLLNNDTVVAPDFLARLIDGLQSGTRCGIIAPKILYHDSPDTIWYAGGEISLWTGSMRHLGIRQKDDGRSDNGGPTGYATGCCFLTTREVVNQVGLLDESYAMYGEDADFSFRVRRAGYTILYEPRAKVWHRLSVSAGGHLSVFKIRRKAAGIFRFFSRHASWYHWLVWPWMSLLVNLGAAARYLVTRPR